VGDELGPIPALIGTGRLGQSLLGTIPRTAGALAYGGSTSPLSTGTRATEEPAADNERLVESAIYRSVAAVVQKDRRLAEAVPLSKSRVNQMEIEIDDQAIRLLALQQPMAGDLTLITSVIKINTDPKRMGNLAVNIGQRAVALMDEPSVQPYGSEGGGSVSSWNDLGFSSRAGMIYLRLTG
jgi:hypothetical protein